MKDAPSRDRVNAGSRVPSNTASEVWFAKSPTRRVNCACGAELLVLRNLEKTNAPIASNTTAPATPIHLPGALWAQGLTARNSIDAAAPLPCHHSSSPTPSPTFL